MANVKIITGKQKFGLGQITNPTPSWVKTIFKVFFYITGLTTIILDTFTEIPPDTKLLITSWVLRANVLLHAITRLFGVEVTDNSLRLKAQTKTDATVAKTE